MYNVYYYTMYIEKVCLVYVYCIMYNVYYYTMYIEKVCLVYVYCIMYNVYYYTMYIVYVYCLVYTACYGTYRYYCQKTLRDANYVAIGMLNFYFCPMHV